MELNELLDQFNNKFENQRDKGSAFEDLIAKYLQLDPLYSNDISEVWKWSDFPYRGSVGDTGIDIVAKTYMGEFWAIQCKFYSENTSISKGDVDTFLSTSSKYFYVDGKQTKFAHRFFVSTTDSFSKNAEDVLRNQDPPVSRIGMEELLNSPIDWEKFVLNDTLALKDKYGLRPHQREAIDDVLNGFKTNNRGKLIMACGTGKTFTSLRCAEELLNGRGSILFLVPSIALVNQTLSEWSAQSNYSFDSIVVCSDNKASKNEDNTNMVDDLIIPSTTDINALKKWVETIQTAKTVDNKKMHYVFSTYQSIKKVAEMQKVTGFHFDLMICDEAHRTTGVKLSGEDESYFTKVHDDSFIQADKRLYMTATPRVYGSVVKEKAKDADAILCSMDDEKIYGPEFHCLSFGDAVKQGLLTDYKVLILAIDEEYVKKELQGLLTDENHEIKMDDAVKIMGCWKGLSKVSIDPNDKSFTADPTPMKRAVAFTNRIKDSVNLVNAFKQVQEYMKMNHPVETERLTDVEIQHVDGSFNAIEKKKRIQWLKDNTEENECRILTNARCLSEGVDVPALDAVIFLNPRSSIVDIIQSVGRVMRKAEGKLYGYIVLPIGISATEEPEKALDNNAKYKIVWDVLQALRSHDDRFDNTINKISLNKKRPDQISVVGIGEDKTDSQDSDNGAEKAKKIFEVLTLDLDSLEDWQNSIYAKMVKKVGSRLYWERWASNVGEIAKKYKDRINKLLEKHDKRIETAMNDFVVGLQNNLNGSITQEDAIEMLSQHLITKPIFDALFGDYEFVASNPVSKSMERMIKILDNPAMNTEKEGLEKFYNSVRKYVNGIDNAEAKQNIVKDLYERFFKVAMPTATQQLGIVYTPIECVDFIIHSVEKVMNNEFKKSLSDKNVHIIDGFTGTGTFIVRLLQSGIIKPEDLLYKYTNEIHANEYVLLAYYIAAINIEEAFHELSNSKEYVPFDGIVMTDTFQLYEDWKEDEFTKAINEETLPANSRRAKRQRELPITVCIGNPPYSIGQKSANDNAQNMHYEKLDNQIERKYSKFSKANLKRGLYDNYIRAFRWATDRITENGIIGFITNGAYIDNAGMDGFRKCLLGEFTSVYVFNLRGNQRTSGETSRKEGGKIFGSGSRTPVAITILVKNSNKEKDGYVHYYDIGDYLTREQKLAIIADKHDITQIEWKTIEPDQNNDWINKKNQQFSRFIKIAPEKKENAESKSFFSNYSLGIGTAKDSWLYNFSSKKLEENVVSMINYFNEERRKYQNDSAGKSPKEFVKYDSKRIVWTDLFLRDIKRNIEYTFNKDDIVISNYRPFCKMKFVYNKNLIQRTYQMPKIYPSDCKENLMISMSGTKNFTVLMSKNVVDLHYVGDSQTFPIHWWEKEEKSMYSYNLIGDSCIEKDGITDYIKNKIVNKYQLEINKEDIFYYVYGILHSNDYRNKFNADLKKELPRIPLVDAVDIFKIFSDAGKKLADLHLNYETVAPYPNVVVAGDENIIGSDEYEFYAVNKMKFLKKGQKGTIIYNDHIRVMNIPDKAYEYIVNGKSAIEWIMERYAITTDKASGIVNNPNDWSKEVGNPRYILDLLLSIINVSVQTVDLVNSLPKLKFND